MARQVFFAIALFLSSAGGLVIEIVAGRLIAPYVGMSLYTWTAIIAVVLAGLSGGHWIGGRLAGRDVDERTGAGRLAWALVLACASSLASLVLLRVLSGPLLTSGMGPIPVVVILTTALFLLPSLFVGIVSPILTKLAIDESPDDPGPVLGRMYALGTLGSIAGTLSAGYFFISWIGSIGTVLSFSAVAGVVARSGAVWAKRVADAVAGALVLAMTAGGLGLWGNAVRAFASPCTTESDYFCIRIDDFSATSGRPSALMALDHLVHSINDRNDPTLLYSPYLHFVDEFAALRFAGRGRGQPFTSFFIGGGGYTLPRAWAEAFSGARITVAELDPKVTRAAAESLWLDTKHPALTIEHRDARALLQEMPAEPRFDVVFGDAFRDIAIPAHLITREFNREIAKRLNPGGFYAVNVIDIGTEPEFLASFVRTLLQDFKSVEIWAEADELAAGLAGRGQRVTYVVISSQTPSALPPKYASRRSIEREWARWPVAELNARFGPETPVLTDDFAPVDRLMAKLLLTPEH
ncbi:MAG: fused MFS/spermidine synthase [Rhodospirillaceae bacterium]